MKPSKSPTYSPKVGIIATTFTGNHGAEAMLTVCIEQVKNKFPEAEIHVLTYAPQSDLEWLSKNPIENVWLHSSTPFKISISWFPLSLLLRFLPFLKKPLREEHGQGMSTLLSLDVIVDFAGVAFMDGREKFLPFNVLTLFPFLLHKVPVVKLSQAIGPITSPINRLLAGWVLPRLAYLAARGQKTAAHLRDFALDEKNWSYAPDTAFLLKLDTPLKPSIERNGIIIMPSSLMLKKDPAYPKLLIETIQILRKNGHQVSLLAHSWKEHSNLPRNNDYPLCQQIHRVLGSPENMKLYGPGLDARGLKEKISQYRIAVTSRFHGMIAALDSVTPVWVLGWSHKYREVLSEFEVDICAIDTENLSPNVLADKIIKGYEEAPELALLLEKNLPRIRKECTEQFEKLFKIITDND